MIVIIQKRVSFIGVQNRNAFHSQVFHGMATRGGVSYPSFRDLRFNDTHEKRGLDIIRSLSEWPQLPADDGWHLLKRRTY